VRRNVLVVDDDPLIQDLVKFFLEQAGFVVRVCKDGHSAWDELNSNPYDLVILDISMPHMSGMKVLKSIRASAILRELPVIMLTSSQDKDDILLAKRNKVTDYLTKPPEKDTFLKRVELVMGGRPQFEEVELSVGDPESVGSFSLPISLKSISNNGVVLIGEVPLIKDALLRLDHLNLFQTLKIKNMEFKITDCAPVEGGKFQYFISFIDMVKADHEKIREWIMATTYRRKNGHTKVS